MNRQVPDVDILFRENGQFVKRDTKELFSGKKIVLFSLPGAFTPTCSAYQLPGYEESYDDFVAFGIDEIYCVSVNDAFVMNAWAKDQNIQKVKLIPDGNGEFTQGMDMLVSKRNLGFAMRSWRYAAVIDDGNVEYITAEMGRGDNVNEDPYETTTPESILNYLKLAVQ